MLSLGMVPQRALLLPSIWTLIKWPSPDQLKLVKGFQQALLSNLLDGMKIQPDFSTPLKKSVRNYLPVV